MPENEKRIIQFLDLGASLPPPSFMGFKSAKLEIRGSGLPRNNKVELELDIAKDFIDSVARKNQLLISNVRSNNPNDPPDVCFNIGDNTYGVELTEITPVNRLERDNILNRIKNKILQSLSIDEQTKGWVVSVSLESDNSKKLMRPV